MPPRPSRGPTSLHLASLGSPFALLTDPPPPRFTSFPSRRILPAVFPLRHLFLLHHFVLFLLLLLLFLPAVLPARRSSRPHARARETRGAPSFLFLLSHGCFLSFSIGGSSRARPDLTHPPAVLVLLLLPVPPRPPPPGVLIDRPCTRA